MPFSMTYGTKAFILIEISLSSLKVVDFTESHNDELMIGNLDALEERRDMVSVRLANYQQKLAQRYTRKVRPQEFVVGNLVLQKAIGSMKDHNASKLAPNWERPYQVTVMAKAGAYSLEDVKERPLP